jgi:hypothetical protein
MHGLVQGCCCQRNCVGNDAGFSMQRGEKHGPQCRTYLRQGRVTRSWCRQFSRSRATHKQFQEFPSPCSSSQSSITSRSWGRALYRELGTSRSSVDTSTAAANQPLHRPPSSTSPCTKRRQQGDAGGPNPAIVADPHNSGEAVGLGGRGGWSTARDQKSTRGSIVGRRGRGRNNVDRVSMITMPGNLEVSDGGEAVEISALEATPTSGLIASHGWVPPAIVPDTRSPFLLRPRTSSGHVPAQAVYTIPISRFDHHSGLFLRG